MILKRNCPASLLMMNGIIKGQQKYRDGTKLERLLPIMFIILYVVAAAVILAIK